jgi:hypothetical protein
LEYPKYIKSPNLGPSITKPAWLLPRLKRLNGPSRKLPGLCEMWYDDREVCSDRLSGWQLAINTVQTAFNNDQPSTQSIDAKQVEQISPITLEHLND